MFKQPHIVVIGGTVNSGSSTENSLKIALAAAQHAGASVRFFDGPMLADLPHYGPGVLQQTAIGKELIEAVRNADGLILGSPGYHGGISGLVKNAIDYLEETARDERVYLDGMPVGLVVTAYGWQATGSTLASLRATVHALRGWPTPLGASIKATSGLFANGECSDEGVIRQLEIVGQQVVAFANMQNTLLAATHAQA